jgi:hypothetical protein
MACVRQILVASAVVGIVKLCVHLCTNAVGPEPDWGLTIIYVHQPFALTAYFLCR